MGKIGAILLLTAILLPAADIVEKNCLACHQKQQIPSELIYKRYLLKYSTHDRIYQAIYRYLKNPQKERSIMPPQFFLKFPMKKPLKLDDASLHESLELFLQKYDPRRKLRLKE